MWKAIGMTVAAFAALLPAPLRADTITLENGSVVVGTIDHVAGGKIGVHTDFAGDIIIDLAGVRGISTDAPRSIALSSGNVIVGVLDFSDGAQIVRSDEFGDLSISVADLSSMSSEQGAGRRMLTPREGETTQEAAIRQEYEEKVADIQSQADEEVAALQEQVDALQNPWTGTLDFGITGRTGSTERFALNAGAEAVRTTPKDTMRLFFRANWAVENGSNTENEVFGGADYEYNLTENWYVYGRAYLEYDEFERLDFRGVFTGGTGYYWVRNDKTQFKTYAGAGYRYESFNTPQTVSEGVIELGYELRTKLWERIDFVHGGVYTPSLDEFSDFRFDLYTTLDWQVAETSGWYLRAGMWNRYNSRPQPGVELWDTNYVLGLAYKF